MVEFVSRYEKFEGHEYNPNLTGHGAIYGTTSCGKSHLVDDLCLNGRFSHCRTIVFLNGKSTKKSDKFVADMKDMWETLIYSYQIRTEEELLAKINEIEDALIRHRNTEYKRLGVPSCDDIDLRPGMAFANVKIVIDDLHKQVVKSVDVAAKFAFIRHSGVEMLFVTQSFKNVNMHDLVKENLMWVVLFKLSQNKVTLNSFLDDLSLHSSKSRTKGQLFRSSLQYIYTKLVLMNDSVLGFDPDDTSYLYIEMPKRAPKNVSHVRTAIANPHRQVCFKEEGCAQVKILFAKRTEKLTFENRMNAMMRVMSEREQTRYMKEGQGEDHLQEEMENPENGGEVIELGEGRGKTGKTSFETSFSKQRDSFKNHNRGVIKDECDSGDSTDIPSENEDIYPLSKSKSRYKKRRELPELHFSSRQSSKSNKYRKRSRRPTENGRRENDVSIVSFSRHDRRGKTTNFPKRRRRSKNFAKEEQFSFSNDINHSRRKSQSIAVSAPTAKHNKEQLSSSSDFD